MTHVVAKAGSLIRTTARFKNTAGALADPPTVVVKWEKPDDSVVTKTYVTDAEVVRSSTGVYYMEQLTADGEEGKWTAQWEGVGLVVDDVWFTIKERAIS